ncbi:MAG: disulfide bond formation protein DsbB [Hyphomicrobiaceae bacterium]|jgi:disulfide bond formation protein DsbB
MAQKTSAIYKQPAYRWGSLSLFVTIAIILGALGFEYLGGFKPCPLCLQQRYAYYIAIPVLFFALVLLSAEKKQFAMALLFFISMVFLANSAFGVYHAGAEWGFWAAPMTCGGTGNALQGGGMKLLSALKNVDVVDCGKPSLIILGLSLAGWNAIISLCLTIGCLKAAFYASEDAVI